MSIGSFNETPQPLIMLHLITKRMKDNLDAEMSGSLLEMRLNTFFKILSDYKYGAINDRYYSTREGGSSKGSILSPYPTGVGDMMNKAVKTALFDASMDMDEHKLVDTLCECLRKANATQSTKFPAILGRFINSFTDQIELLYQVHHSQDKTKKLSAKSF